MHNLKRAARTSAIPTNDFDVKMGLRQLGQPICLFGEKIADRRDRLKKIVGEYTLKYGSVPSFAIKRLEEKKSEKNEENEPFLTPGIQELKDARLEIAKFSIPKSAFRLEISKKQFMEIDRIQENNQYETFLDNIKDYELLASQYADERGCIRGNLNKSDSLYAVAGSSG